MAGGRGDGYGRGGKPKEDAEVENGGEVQVVDAAETNGKGGGVGTVEGDAACGVLVVDLMGTGAGSFGDGVR